MTTFATAADPVAEARPRRPVTRRSARAAVRSYPLATAAATYLVLLVAAAAAAALLPRRTPSTRTSHMSWRRRPTRTGSARTGSGGTSSAGSCSVHG